MPTIKTYGEAGRFLKHEGSDDRKKRFEELLQGRFDAVPQGKFSSTLPGIESLSIIRPKSEYETGEVKSLYIVAFFENERGKLFHTTFTVFDDGTLDGELPKWANFTKDELYAEVLNIIEDINIDFFISVDDAILPPDDQPLIIEKGDEKVNDRNKSPKTDPRRVEFMVKQEQSLFGFNGINSGLRGYYGFVFPRAIVLENDKIRNAVFIYQFETPLDVDKSIFDKPPNLRMSEEERRAILEKIWKPVAELTKTQIQEAGAIRVVHPSYSAEDWEKRMKEAINEFATVDVF